MELVYAVADDHIKKWSENRGDPQAFTDFRLKLWRKVKSLPLPVLKYSLGVGTRLNPLHIKDLPVAEDSVSLSGKGYEVTQGSNALARKEVFSLINPEENQLTALHASLLTSIMVIEIPAGDHEPLVISSDLKNRWNADHIVIIAHPRSKGMIIDYSLGGKDTWRTHGVEIIALEGSNLTYAGVQNLAESATLAAFHIARVEKDAKVTWIEGNFGTDQLLARTLTNLVGTGGHVVMHELFYSHQKQRFDMEGIIHHRAPLTKSDLLARGVVDDRSKSLYRGLIKIHRNASSCVGHQREDTLLLSGDAESDAIPILEIDNDDVQCSHSATVGKIDPEVLFYLQSRGISEHQAKKMYVTGFFESLFQEIKDKEIHKSLTELVRRRMGDE